MITPAEYLPAMSASAIPEGESYLWLITKLNFPEGKLCYRHWKPITLPRGTYTYLTFLTDEKLLRTPPGEVVMEDTPFELRTHLGFVMNAYGRVLVTGLGLGCVIRGLLVNPDVEHITCIENSEHVLRLVAPHMPTDRVTIIQADALEWCAQNRSQFDCGWHDLWTNREVGQPHLDAWHQRLLLDCRRYVKHQGAWAYDRSLRTYLKRRGFQWMG